MPSPRSTIARSALVFAVVAASVGTSAPNVALPSLTHAFSTSAASARGVIVTYLVGMTAASVVVGYLGDRFGRRRVLLIGLSAFIATAVLAAAAPSLPVLMAARSVQGVAAAIMTSLPIALARDVSEDGRTGRIMGLLGTSSAVGTMLGPSVGGLLVQMVGWRGPFVAMLPFAGVALVLVTRSPRADRVRPDLSRFDGAGAALTTVAIATYALALTAPLPGWAILLLLLAAAAVLLVTILVEARTRAPIVPLALVGTRALGSGMLTNALVATVMMTTLVVGPFYLEGSLGLPPIAVGLVMAVGPVVSALSGVLAGWLVDRGSVTALVSTGVIVMTLGAGALALLPRTFGILGYIVGLVVLTPGYQLFLSANNTQVMSLTAAERRGTAAGLLGLARNLGLITGSSAMGGVYAALTGSSGSSAAHTHALSITFAVAAALVAVAAGVSFLPGRRARPDVIHNPRSRP